jgi:hypothetical protein
VTTKRAQGDGALTELLAWAEDEARRTAEVRAAREARAREAAGARERGKARQLANLKRREDLQTHGCYLPAGTFLRCRRCRAAKECEHWSPGRECLFEKAYHARRTRELRAEPGVTPENWPMFEALIWLELRTCRAMMDAAYGGAMNAGGRVTRVQRDSTEWVGQYLTQLTALGLTPLQRKRDPAGIARRALRVYEKPPPSKG